MGLTNFTNAIRKESYKWFIEKYDPAKAAYNILFEVEPWHEAYKQETSAFGTGILPEKPVGTDFTTVAAGEAYSPLIAIIPYGYKVTISREEQDWTKRSAKDLAREIAKSWPQDVADTKDQVAASMFNNGGLTAGHSIFNATITGIISDSSGDLAYDSKPMFNLTGNNRSAKAHSTTYFNAIASNLTEANARTLWTRFTVTNNRKEDGEIVTIKPTHIVHGGALTFKARAILESTNIPGSADNDVNVLKAICQDVEWQQITDTDAWAFVLAKMGLKFLVDVDYEIKTWIDDNNGDLCASCYTRFGVGLVNWRTLAGSNWATS